MQAAASSKPSAYQNGQTWPVVLDEVTKVYPGNVRALREVSLRVEAGERACLLGPNGAGKTTIVRLISGALRPTHGRVRMFGISADGPSFVKAKRRAGIVPQAPGMYDDFTCAEYLTLVRRLYGCGNNAAIVDDFGLGPYLNRPLAQLSGGFQRRATLAAALLPGPELLLLDEPTVGLDPVAARETQDILRRVMEERTTLLCTHNLAEAEALCDSVIILRGGEVLLHEKINALRGRFPRCAHVVANQEPAVVAAELSRFGQQTKVDGRGVQLALPHPERDLPPLLRLLLSSGIDVFECHVVEPNLEEMFLQLVEEGRR